jgi:rod shape-determining protein MreD
MSRSRSILFFVLVFLVQLAISNFLNLGPWITISLIPFLILQIPLQRTPHVVMLSAFGLGLLLDWLSAGVLGLNAFAALMAAAPRRLLYRLIVNGERQEPLWIPLLRDTGLLKYLNYLLSLTAIYLAAFILLDCVSVRPFGFILVKFVVSTLISTLLGLLLAFAFQRRS